MPTVVLKLFAGHGAEHTPKVTTTCFPFYWWKYVINWC